MRRLLLFSAAVLVVLSAVALAQRMIPIPSDDVPVNDWSSAHGAIFDGGLSVGAAGTLGANTLGANECQARFEELGYDTERSPVVKVLDEPATSSRVVGFALEWVALDAGLQEISFNQTPLVYGIWWRAYAGGTDAGLPWFYVGSFSLTGSGGPTSRTLARFSNTSAASFAPGFNCFVPLITGAGVAKVYQRVNVIRVPVTHPR